MSEFKQRVAARFDTAAASYDAHSSVQRHAAQRLAGLIATTGLPPRPRVLEIGCGTGHLTAELLPRLPGAHILATDIAPAMVAACRRRLSGHALLSFATMDGCRPASAEFGGRRPGRTGAFDLVCANLAAQWFADLPAALASLASCLAPGGRLAVSLLGAETFREWRAAHASFGLSAGTLPLLTEAQCRAAFPAGGQLAMTADLHCEHPASGIDFLRSLRAIGADTSRPGHAPLTTAQLRRVLSAMGPQPSFTYELLYCCWQRPPL